MPCIHFQDGILTIGGPTYWMWLNGRKRPFEMHPQCGPTLLHKTTLDPLESEAPEEFWDTAERWLLGGSMIEEDGETIIVPAWCIRCRGEGFVPHDKVEGQVVRCPDCKGDRI